MELKLPNDPRSKKLMGGAVAALLAVGAYWYLLWKPDHDVVVGIAAHADTLEIENAKIRKEVESGAEKRIKADAERYTAELAVLRRLVPTQDEVPALIDAISTAARMTGMEISEYAPDGDMPGDYFDAKKFKFSVTGPYHKVAEFFTAIGSLDRIVTPINVNLFPSGRALERKPGRNEVFIDAQFGVLTYVAKTTMPIAAARP
ncbi:MAG TPA: type 4a pilus biogenesis protein PilO [Gemmatimonadaceae bacterium]|nr:type 4a pilus biogenesis protein PilO [Gemmatimonadaceae bacterium]